MGYASYSELNSSLLEEVEETQPDTVEETPKTETEGE